MQLEITVTAKLQSIIMPVTIALLLTLVVPVAMKLLDRI